MRCCAWVQAHLARGNAATRSRGVVSSVSAWRNPAAAAPRHDQAQERERERCCAISLVSSVATWHDRPHGHERGRKAMACGWRGTRSAGVGAARRDCSLSGWLLLALGSGGSGDGSVARLVVVSSSRLLPAARSFVSSPPLARSLAERHGGDRARGVPRPAARVRRRGARRRERRRRALLAARGATPEIPHPEDGVRGAWRTCPLSFTTRTKPPLARAAAQGYDRVRI